MRRYSGDAPVSSPLRRLLCLTHRIHEFVARVSNGDDDAVAINAETKARDIPEESSRVVNQEDSAPSAPTPRDERAEPRPSHVSSTIASNREYVCKLYTLPRVYTERLTYDIFCALEIAVDGLDFTTN